MPKTTFLLTALALWWLWLYRTQRPFPGVSPAPSAIDPATGSPRGAGLIGPPVLSPFSSGLPGGAH